MKIRSRLISVGVFLCHLGITTVVAADDTVSSSPPTAASPPSPPPSSSGCAICQDGSSDMTRPDKKVFIPSLGYNVLCSLGAAMIPNMVESDSPECRTIHQISSVCGCQPPEGSCSLCRDGSSVIISDDVDTRELPEYSDIFGGVPNCELMEAYLHSISSDEGFCLSTRQDIADRCGCPNATPDDQLNSMSNFSTFVTPSSEANNTEHRPPPLSSLIGMRLDTFGEADDHHKLRRHRSARISSILAIIGALSVVLDNLIAHNKLKRNVYNQIIIAMATVDTLFAVATALGNLPMSTENPIDLPFARGNDATCKAQGWFIQFGCISSLLLNASLSTYFVAVIVLNFRQTALKRLRKYLIGVPILIGLLLAFGALPFYSASILGCHLSPPAGDAEHIAAAGVLPDTWGPFLGFFLVPAWLVIGYTTTALGLVCCHVSKVDQKAKKWRFGSDFRLSGHTEFSMMDDATSDQSFSAGRRTRRHSSYGRKKTVNRIQNEVFWQSAAYLLSLYMSWFTYLVICIDFEKYIVGYYELWLFTSILYPLQPFLNCLVYFRPRLSRYLRRYFKAKRRGAEHRGQYFSYGSSRDGFHAFMEPAADLVELKDLNFRFPGTVVDDETEKELPASPPAFDDKEQSSRFWEMDTNEWKAFGSV